MSSSITAQQMKKYYNFILSFVLFCVIFQPRKKFIKHPFIKFNCWLTEILPVRRITYAFDIFSSTWNVSINWITKDQITFANFFLYLKCTLKWTFSKNRNDVWTAPSKSDTTLIEDRIKIDRVFLPPFENCTWVLVKTRSYSYIPRSRFCWNSCVRNCRYSLLKNNLTEKNYMSSVLWLCD